MEFYDKIMQFIEDRDDGFLTLENFRDKIEELLEKSIYDVQLTNEDFDSEIESLREDNKELQNQVEDLENDIDGYKKEIQKLNNQINKLESISKEK